MTPARATRGAAGAQRTTRRLRMLAGLALAGLALGCSEDARAPQPSDEPAPSAPSPASANGRPAQALIRFGTGDDAPQMDLHARSMARVAIEVHDPYETRLVRFEGLPANAVLDQLLGPAWRSADELVFECADGYRAAVPVTRLLTHEAYFAVARVGGPFVIDKPIGGDVVRTELAPAYLVWENQRDALVRSEGDWGWPYQIVGVSAASASERYARMTPPAAGASGDQAAERGFATFRRYCARCHAINGQGGEVGPELNYPASVTEYFEPTWLRRFIDQPLSVRQPTRMPGLPQGIPARDQALDDILAYLNAMARRKLPPEAEAP